MSRHGRAWRACGGYGAALPPHLSSDVNKLSAAALPVDKAVLIDLFDALAGHSYHLRHTPPQRCSASAGIRPVNSS